MSVWRWASECNIKFSTGCEKHKHMCKMCAIRNSHHIQRLKFCMVQESLIEWDGDTLEGLNSRWLTTIRAVGSQAIGYRQGTTHQIPRPKNYNLAETNREIVSHREQQEWSEFRMSPCRDGPTGTASLYEEWRCVRHTVSHNMQDITFVTICGRLSSIIRHGYSECQCLKPHVGTGFQ